MGFRLNEAVRFVLCMCFVVGLCGAAFADESHERTQFGRNITIGPDEQVGEATCFGCSIRIRGHVSGDVTSFGGNVVVEEQAEVGGDTTTFGGNVRLDKGASVKGVTVFGGRVHRDPGALVAGDVTNFSGGGWMLLIFGLPLVVLGAFIALIVWVVRMLTRPRVPAAA